MEAGTHAGADGSTQERMRRGGVGDKGPHAQAYGRADDGADVGGVGHTLQRNGRKCHPIDVHGLGDADKADQRTVRTKADKLRQVGLGKLDIGNEGGVCRCSHQRIKSDAGAPALIDRLDPFQHGIAVPERMFGMVSQTS